MNSNALISPSQYCDSLKRLVIPGYEGDGNGQVALTSYMSANKSFKSWQNGAFMSAAMTDVVKNKPEFSLTTTDGFKRVFTGQGSRDDTVAAMSIVVKYKDEFKAKAALKKCFEKPNYLQALSDEAFFGLDCIGFVGNYLVEAKLEATYQGRAPIDYGHLFPFVLSLSEVKPLAVVMLTNGLHIQIIDEVTAVGPDFIVVDLCQSSSGGPQCNVGVTIRAGGGSFLPVQPFRDAKKDPAMTVANEKDNAERAAAGKKPRDLETYLRDTLTQQNVKVGVNVGFNNGAIFQLNGGGQKPNPVSGSVYIGVAPGLALQTPAMHVVSNGERPAAMITRDRK